MIFGDGLVAAPSKEPAAWVQESLSLQAWTVGGLLPRHYESYLLLEPAQAPPINDWWSAQREVVSVLAQVLTEFTRTPERSWFAIWEGHGFGRSEAIGEALRAIPRFEMPLRTYYLLSGHTLDVSRIRWPEPPDHWFRPDLWWPDDRSWFVGTDVDFWCSYVGGTASMTAAVAARVPGRCLPVTLDERLRIED